jgi:hypothetical protein
VSAPRPLAAIAALIAVASLAVAGCGSDDEGAASTSDEPVRMIETARSGSFLPDGEDGELRLVMRGVGGTTAIAASSPGEGPAGAISTAKLLREAATLLGPEPLEAELTSAEIEPLGYSLLLSDATYDPRIGAITWRAEVVSGQPELPPGSFGAATLAIESGAEAATLTGTAIMPASGEKGGGSPLAGALVSVELDGLGIATARTDEEGRFELGPLPAASYRVEATLAGYVRDDAQVELPGSDPPELELVPIGEGG